MPTIKIQQRQQFPHITMDDDDEKRNAADPKDVDNSSSNNENDNDVVVLPLEIQVALLEDTFFGWNHLSSTILGHTVLPIMAYAMTYETLSRYGFGYWWMFLDNISTITQTKNNYQESTTTTSNLWIISSLFSHIFGIVVGFSTLCFIRQRRRVWLRNAYGSKAYTQDRIYRRRSVIETDKLNTLGKIISKIQEKRRQRLLRRAKDRFAKKHKLQNTPSVENGDQESTTGPRRRKLFSRRIAEGTTTTTRQSYATISTDNNISNDDDQGYDTTSSASSTLSVSKSFSWEYNASLSPCSSTDNLQSTMSRTLHTTDEQATRLTSQNIGDGTTSSMSTMSTNISTSTSSYTQQQQRLYHPTSITQDHVKIPRIDNIAYAHGGFFGAAPFVLADPKWVTILRKLLPDVYVEISRRILITPTPRLIHWAENNPVIAAYGVVQTMIMNERHQKQHRDSNKNETSTCNFNTSDNEDEQTIPTIEWDIFLDPRLVRRVEAVLDAKEQYHNDYKNQQKGKDEKKENVQRDKVVEYLDKELKQRCQELTDHLLIAHGNLLQIIIEQTGLLKSFNYSRVQRTRRTLGGGMYARQWMAIFAEALRLGWKSQKDNPSDDKIEDTTWHYDDDDDDHDAKNGFSSYLDICLDTTIEESLDLIREITQLRQPLRLVLDLKSRHVPKRVLGAMIDTLHGTGIRVEGIGSFQFPEIRGLNQHVRSENTKEIIYLHSAGDLQRLCDEGHVHSGDQVFFNGGSLIWETARPSLLMSLWQAIISLGFDDFEPQSIQLGYRINPCSLEEKDHEERNNDNNNMSDVQEIADSRRHSCLSTLKTLHDYKRQYKFSLGIYVQEFSIDEAAVRLLVDHVNEYSELYDLGFAWGGVNGMTVKGIQPGRFTSTDGYWNQRHVGQRWRSKI